MKQMKQPDTTEFLSHVRELLELDEHVVLDLDTKLSQIEEWDSLIALSFMAMAKEKYDADLGGEDVRNAETLGDFYDLITQD